MSDHKTHFGFSTVDEDEKAGKVAEVFHSVAKNYDIMNDARSLTGGQDDDGGGARHIPPQRVNGPQRVRSLRP